MRLSVVIPVYHEEDNIAPLLEAVRTALTGIEHEVILVDDGSQDGTVDAIRRHAGPEVKTLVFARNYGQTSAMAAGIEAATGDYIVTLDGDLQNDPADIPLMLAKLEAEGLDVVMGYRANRQDGAILRTWPSRVANRLIRHLSGVHIRDYGCTLKLFRQSVAKRLDLYGELHRFIPILARMYGARMAEMPVRHHARQFGRSKYGIGRTTRVLSDLLLMLFFLKYRQRPMHLFGTLGLGMFAGGSIIAIYLGVEKLLGHDIADRPIFLIGILLLIMAVQFVTAGFLSELMMRTYFESQGKKPYFIAYALQGGERVE